MIYRDYLTARHTSGGGVIADELMVTENVLALRLRLADGL